MPEGIKSPFSTDPPRTTTADPSGFMAGDPNAMVSLFVINEPSDLTGSKISIAFLNGFATSFPFASTGGGVRPLKLLDGVNDSSVLRVHREIDVLS